MSQVQPLLAIFDAALLWEISSFFIVATFFSVAAGIGAYVKGRLPGRWMLASFFLGPVVFLVLLFNSDE